MRILITKNVFSKGYTRSWSLEIYKIKEAISENGIDYYKVVDLAGNLLPRDRYYWQLNLVARDDSKSLRKYAKRSNQDGSAQYHFGQKTNV